MTRIEQAVHRFLVKKSRACPDFSFKKARQTKIQSFLEKNGQNEWNIEALKQHIV
jgi:hypothetical protein